MNVVDFLNCKLKTMAQIQDFTPEQMKEAEDWYKENNPILLDKCQEHEWLMQQLYDVFFKLKRIKTYLKPNQFVIGVDYTGATDKEYRTKGDKMDLSKLQVNLSFWNPHPKGVADTLAKDILIAQISKL